MRATHQWGEQELGQQATTSNEPVLDRREVAVSVEIDSLVAAPGSSSKAAEEMQQLDEDQPSVHE